MGIFGYGLYNNDITCDVRDTYIQLLENQAEDQEAFDQMLEKYKEIIGDIDEPFFWLALAETQWRVGRLMPQVNTKALELIESNCGTELWEGDKAGLKKWKNTLEKLKQKLLSPMPKKRKFPKERKFSHNPWEIGDIYAYKFHTHDAIKYGLLNKYIVMQKIGNVECEWKSHSIVQVFDKVFDEIPKYDDLENIRVLPLTYPPGYWYTVNEPPYKHQMPKTKEEYFPSFDRSLRAMMGIYKAKSYPGKYLTFIYNEKIKEQNFEGNQYEDFSDFFWKIDDWLGEYYSIWENIEY